MLFQLLTLKQIKHTTRVIVIACLFWSSSAYSFDVNNEILAITKLPEVLKQGQKLFENNCASCHGKKLQGGIGFNLKDERWVHGEQPSEILNSIKNGFANAGMPSFGALYPEDKLKKITAYILSQQQGLRNLTYKIYHIVDNAPKNFNIIDNTPANKSGSLTSNLMAFNMPEVKNYIIEFEGVLLAPEKEDSKIFAMIDKRMLFEVSIDGEIVQPTKKNWLNFAWPIKRGKQRLKIRYSTIGTQANHNKSMGFFINNENLTRKLFSISQGGKLFLNKATVNIKAEDQFLVQRKKIVNLPTYSVSVGFPEKINFAFNTKSCSIVGVWSGEMINVGPNVEGRARDGALILGDWGFHEPHQINHQVSDKQPCTFIKYNRQQQPSFVYQFDKQIYSLTVNAVNNKSLTLSYELLSGNGKKINTLALPKLKNVVFSDTRGDVITGSYNINTKYGKKSPLTLTLIEAN